MTRFIYDEFAKQYLEELLSNFGSVELNKNVSSEVQFIDVFFTPSAEKKRELNQLGLLGKIAQKESLMELKELPLDNNFKSVALELVYNLLTILESRQGQNQPKFSEDKELIMRLSPEYLERLESATQKGVQQGFQQTLTERRSMVETLLIFRFGEIDQKLSNIIEPLIQISAAESTSLLISLSKEELLSRFNS